MAKLTESQLRKAIREAVEKRLNNKLNEDNNHFRGCKKIKMIWHGDWADPELMYNGHVANYWDIEDSIYNAAIEDGVNADDDAEFNAYCQAHEDEICNDIIEFGEEEYNPFDDMVAEEKVVKLTSEDLNEMVKKAVRNYMKK